MKRWIHAATDVITKEDVKDAMESDWYLQIDTPDMIAYCTDSDVFCAIDLNKAANFLNSAEGQKYMNEYGDIYSALTEASYENPDCGMSRYDLPDSNGWGRNDISDIVQVFKEAGVNVPDWVYE